MGKHVIVGGGQVGGQLATQLHEAGHDVTVVTRSGRGPSEVTNVAADASDAARLTEIAKGADALYNCANPAYHRWLTDWPPLSDSLLRTAEDTGAVYVILGNLYMYAPPTAPMRETDPLEPSMEKAKVRVRMWTDALAAHEAGRARVVEVRASDFFGPSASGQSHLGERFIPRLLAGKTIQFFGDPGQPHSWTYLPDVARALATAAADERAWGRPWHVPTNDPLSAREVAQHMARVAGVEAPKVVPMPQAVLSAVGLFQPLVRELKHVRYQFTAPFIMDSSQFQQTFDQHPTPMDDALLASVDRWR
ncbi:MAG TPA: NAD-dependent epimerase/dehydratase family protein [Stackebrandtia sp.]|jgi:nucleoside-diphosphate-sugar epimerase|uniref:NAD-dependent epimerase/dehydratase family protein n=1 Tax=Stackebrandtia sp. TaxID=2023065 RepID=UPI002D28E3EC|nr:NAD-dependent epimerase/dehydratase family protein [Stackebrandtia sp.]HZE38165.1 NAD-dependent epimerase/dehydratase family protein [Stackebrandtia sp.]